MAKYLVDLAKYAEISRRAAAEGAVLLRNENNALPIKNGETVSIFGRTQFDYYKSGTGSGGMVHTRKVVTPLEGLRANDSIKVNENLVAVYEEWLKSHPFDHGQGWAAEPWSQEEMPVTEELVADAAAKSDMAVIVLGRSAGEDRDSAAEAGSYFLTDKEKDLLSKVTAKFERVAVVLNVGNIIDMNWVNEYKPSSVLYTWQGGEEGGNAIADVLTGIVNPCAKLTDTIAYELKDYPSTENFGDDNKDIYAEDIFVGYRYFETFAKDKVMYPFGFGLSYTSFAISDVKVTNNDEAVLVSAKVTNTGAVAGKEVVQAYVKKPGKTLSQPAKELAGFVKTKLLTAGESETVEMTIPFTRLMSYDDNGVSGNAYAWIMEEGNYEFTVGNSIRDESGCGVYMLAEKKVMEQCRQALAPTEEFERMVNNNGVVAYEKAPLRQYEIMDRINAERPAERICVGDRGIKLVDVYDGKANLSDFVDQLSDQELAWMTMGEGMCSPKVTPGTGGAISGLTPELQHYGIPIICVTDGPSGIRMDCGTKAFSLPNGTCLACTFDEAINVELFEMLGLELRKNKVDSLLGPGMNIHRHPLNGRNFEYFSEDPLMTGLMGAAQIRGLHKWGVTGTIKHFAANNQEHHRRFINSVASERALREIYLKGYEITVKEADGDCIMTSYGAVNGIWTGGNYDLNTTILRNEWGFEGIVMTDWWAELNDEGEKQTRDNLKAMVRAQNDCYMVCDDVKTKPNNIMESLENGSLERAELCRVTENILKFAMTHHVMDRYLDRVSEEEKEDIAAQAIEDEMIFDLQFQDIDENPELDVNAIDTSMNGSTLLGVAAASGNLYKMNFKLSVKGSEISQVPMTITIDSHLVDTHTFNGTNGEVIDYSVDIMSFGYTHYLKFFFGQAGIELKSVSFEFVSEVKFPFNED